MTRSQGTKTNDELLGCVRCGNCCRVAGFLTPKYRRMKSDRQGKKDYTCRYFKEPNECVIYEDRPDVCRVSKQTPFIAIKQRSFCDYFKNCNNNPDINEVIKLLVGTK